MLSYLLTNPVVDVVVMLGTLVFIHEFGHFAAAKLFGVRRALPGTLAKRPSAAAAADEYPRADRPAQLTQSPAAATRADGCLRRN